MAYGTLDTAAYQFEEITGLPHRPRKDPGEKTREPVAETTPDESWTNDEIKEWLDDHGIHHTSAMRKDDLLGEALNYLDRQE